MRHLKESLLRDRAAVIWGAGPVGKAFARELMALGVAVRAFIDIEPRKVGQTVYGVPVWPASQSAHINDDFVVAAVGSPTARAEIRHALLSAGRVELRDFCAVA